MSMDGGESKLRWTIVVVFVMVGNVGCGTGPGGAYGCGGWNEAQIWVDRMTVDLGHVEVGDIAIQRLFIQSTGRDTLYLEDFVIEGSETFFFDAELTERILAPVEPTDDTTGAILDVGWTPQREQLAEANLIIQSNDRDTPWIDVQLWGNSFPEW